MRKPQTKYDLGKVRTRHDPPTLEEAVFAAQGVTTSVEAQVEFAACLTGRPESEVREAVRRAGGTYGAQRERTTTRVVGSRPVTVERLGSRALRAPRQVLR